MKCISIVGPANCSYCGREAIEYLLESSTESCRHRTRHVVCDACERTRLCYVTVDNEASETCQELVPASHKVAAEQLARGRIPKGWSILGIIVR